MSGSVDVNDVSFMPKVGPVDANHKKVSINKTMEYSFAVNCNQPIQWMYRALLKILAFTK